MVYHQAVRDSAECRLHRSWPPRRELSDYTINGNVTVLYRLRNKIGRAYFSLLSRGVLDTAPLTRAGTKGLTVMTLLQKKDIIMYLMAIKTFAHQVPVERIVVVNDGSLEARDIRLLEEHLPALVLEHKADFQNKSCPAGGCWERLLAVEKYVRESYVVQLDADTLTVGEIPEISAAVFDDCSFTIGTWDDQEIESMSERWGVASSLYPNESSHVQLASEANFNQLSDFDRLKYVRGCAGFSGFAKDSFRRDFVEAVSEEMTKALGEKWSEWGSEQVMSNILVANSPRARVLPHPKYADCIKMNQSTSFIHFIGDCRFTRGVYAKRSRAMVQFLKREDAIS